MFADSPVSSPLYAQVEAVLASEIADGTFATESRLPSEESLIERFGVSRPTIRQAVQNLVRRGLLEIRRGKGTYVTQPKITQELKELTGFVEDMEALGRSATARLVDKRILPADPTVARHLAVTPGTQVVRIQRVRLADGLPLSFDETFLPKEIGKKIMRDDLETLPIFSLLEQKYQVPLTEAEYRLEATLAENEVASVLELAVGRPIFLIERTSFTTGHQPIDYERLHYRGDAIQFVTRLARSSATKAHGVDKI